jgi:uncharacterized protein YlbG (UPF0298 family)
MQLRSPKQYSWAITPTIKIYFHSQNLKDINEQIEDAKIVKDIKVSLVDLIEIQ